MKSDFLPVLIKCNDNFFFWIIGFDGTHDEVTLFSDSDKEPRFEPYRFKQTLWYRNVPIGLIQDVIKIHQGQNLPESDLAFSDLID